MIVKKVESESFSKGFQQLRSKEGIVNDHKGLQRADW